MNKKAIVPALAVFIGLLVFGLELFYRKSLFDLTLQDVPKMQARKRL